MTGLVCCVCLPPSLASLSALSFPAIPQCAGIPWSTVADFLEGSFRVPFSIVRGFSAEHAVRAYSADIESVRKTTLAGGSSLELRWSAAVRRAITSALKLEQKLPLGTEMVSGGLPGC